MQGTRRAGFALPIAIFALVLLSALVAGALFVATEELRSGRTDSADQRALAAAESALDSAVLVWNALRNTGDSVGTRISESSESPVPNVAMSVSGVRVQRRGVLLSATASVVGDGRTVPVRHTVAASLRLVGARVVARGALVTPGAVVIDGGVVDGRDVESVPDATRVCGEQQPGSGIITADVARITCVDCASGYDPRVLGFPAVDSSALTDVSTVDLGDETAASLASRATIDLPAGTYAPRPSVASGGCALGDASSWGDPSGASVCAEFYPIVHVRGDATLAAGAVGQGILLVDGVLRVEANARFAGIVVASSVVVDGAGASLIGVVFALGSGGSGPSRVVNGGVVRYASCAVLRAQLGSARLVRTVGRSWVELR
jgi:hypothetical protein